MDSTTVGLLVDIRPFPGMLLFHRAFTRPLVDVDGVETPALWGGVTRIPVSPGPHDLAVYFRYRFQKKARLAIGHAELTADEAVPELPVEVRLGPFNHSHFRVTVG
ncbi:hypothetical protein ACFC1R_16090 [Kitasatospora sp. NPDC056138]|uniref:hypothetical protein n=1 Tax=Kitasatospora sp. NPDC056138 TaxID=3345724 RepID=UPI0035D83A44